MYTNPIIIKREKLDKINSFIFFLSKFRRRAAGTTLQPPIINYLRQYSTYGNGKENILKKDNEKETRKEKA